jgi:hypothetical protein
MDGWMDGRMNGWMKVKVVLRDCLAQFKIFRKELIRFVDNEISF